MANLIQILIRIEPEQHTKVLRIMKANGLPSIASAFRWILERYPEPKATEIEPIEPSSQGNKKS